MSGKFYNLDTRNTLGGDNASDLFVASQKAVKEYVDEQISTIIDTNTDQLVDLKDVKITSVANGQSLVYDSTTSKWINKAIDTSVATWGKITGTLSTQTDLKNALDGKADASHTHTKSQITDFPTRLSAFTDDLGSNPTHTHSQYITEHQDISGKQDKITSTNKLSSDLVDDTNKTHKFVTAIQIESWDNKQDAINDLDTIRQNASSALHSGDNVSSLVNDAGYLTSEDISSVFVYKGTKTSQSQLPTTGNKKGDVWTVSDTGSEYVWNGTSWEYLGQILDLSGYQTKITTTNKLNADLLSEGTTNKLVSQTEKNTWSGKQDALTQTQLTNINLGGTALQPNDNISELNNDAGYLTEHQDISGKQDVIDNTHKLSADLVDDSTSTNKFVTAANKTTWNNKQDAIPDLTTIRANATAGAGAATTIAGYGDIVTHNANEFLTEHQDISGKADKATTLAGYGITDAYTKSQIDGMVSAGMHYKGTKASASALPTTGNQIGDLWNVTDTGANYAWNGTEWDKLSENIDLSGYQTLLSSTNTLNPAFIAQDSTHRFVSDTEKTTWGNKQDAIPDLTTIRANATAGKGAADTIATYGDIVSHDADEFAQATHTHAISDVTNLQTTLDDKQASITSTNKLSADLISDGTTNKVVTATEKSTWNNKQNAISDLVTIRANATAGKEAADTISGYGDIVTHNADEFLTEHQSLAGYVPTSRKINGKSLTADVTLSAGDVGAATSTHKHLTSDVTALTGYTIATTAAAITSTDSLNVALGKLQKSIDGKQASGSYVPNTRKVNGKALSADITLSASDVSALPASTAIPSKVSDLTNDEGFISGITGEDVTEALGYTPYDATNPNGYTSNVGTITGIKMNGSSKGTSGVVDLGTVITEHQSLDSRVPTSRKINGKTLTADITLSAGDVGASATGHKHLTSDVTALTGYTIATQAASIAATDSLNVALGKLQKSIDGKQASGNYVPTSRTVNGKALSSNITLSASDVSALPSTTTIPTISDTYSSTSSNGMSGKAVASAISNLATKATSLSGYGITDAYTKSQIDGKLSGAMHFKGTVASASALPTTDNTQGDMYNVTDTGANYAWDGTEWDKLSENIDLSGLVPNTRTINGKALSGDISLTYSDVGAASTSHTHSYVPTSRKINGKTLNADVTLSASDVGAAASSHNHVTSAVTALTGYTIATTAASIASTDSLNTALGKLQKSIDGKQASGSYVTTARKVNGKALSSDITLSASDVSALSADTNIPTKTSELTNDSGFLTEHQDISGKQDKSTAVTHTASTAVGNTITPVYINASGVATALSYTIAKSVPSNANFSNTTYTAGTGLTLSNTQFNHSNSVTAGTVGTSAATSGSTLAVPYVTYDAQGHITATGTHTHTVSGFVPTSRKINGNALSADITLSAEDVGAAEADHTHTYSEVGAASSAHTHSNYATTSHKHVASDVTALTGYTIATTAAAIASTDSLNVALGKIQKTLDGKQASGDYVPTSRKINGKTLNADVTLTYSDVSAASSSHTHTYSDVGAASSAHTHTYSDVGAASSAHTHSGYAASTHYHATSAVTVLTGYTIATTAAAIASTDSLNTALGKLQKSIDGKQASGSYVPTSRTVNGKALSGNITLSASDVSALPSDTVIPTVPTNVSAFTNDAGYITSYTDTKNTAGTTNKAATKLFLTGATSQAANPQTYSNVNVYIGTDNCLYSNGAKVLTAHQDLSGYVPTSRTVNGKALSGNITLSASDVSAAASDHTHTYSEVGAASAAHTHSTFVKSGTGAAAGMVPAPSTTAGTTKYLREDGTWEVPTNTTYTAGTGLSLSGTTINHATTITAGTAGTSTATSGATLAVPYVTYNNTGHVTAVGTHTHTITGFLTSSSTLDATKLSGTIPSGCYTNTTYSAGTGLSLSGTTINHATSVTAGTAGTTAATSGSVVSVPYVTYNASGHITAAGVRNHTVSTTATVKIDGITSGSSGINRYCACSTAAGTAAKTASITAGTFTLEAGARVTVKFANANTAGTPTLNINSTGAKNIFLLGTQITTGSNKAVLKGMVDFVYDGTQWHIMSVTPATVAMMI